MRRHEKERNQTRTRLYGHSNSEDQNFDRDFSLNEIPDSEWNRTEDHFSTRRNPRGGDDLFRNNEYYTNESDQNERKNAMLGFGNANKSAQWSGYERTGHYGKGPKGYKRTDDRVKENVSEALYSDPNVDATDIEVEVKDGTVILKGSVESRQIKRAAEDCVDHLSGVEDVRNELTIKKSTSPSSGIPQ